jgi:hypothetical protein
MSARDEHIEAMTALTKPNGHRRVRHLHAAGAPASRVRWSRLGLGLLVVAIALGAANLWAVTHRPEPVVVHDRQVTPVTPASCVRAVQAADTLVKAITDTTMTANIVGLQAAIDGATKGVVDAVDRLTEQADDISGMATRYDDARVACLNTMT